MDLIERTKRANELRQNGVPYLAACKQAGINTHAYSVVRRCLSVNEQYGSNPKAIAALEALKAGRLKVTQAIIYEFDGFHRRPMRKPNRRKKEHALQKAVELIANTCEHCTEIVIPRLEPQDVILILDQLTKARHTLQLFIHKIREAANGSGKGSSTS